MQKTPSDFVNNIVIKVVQALEEELQQPETKPLIAEHFTDMMLTLMVNTISTLIITYLNSITDNKERQLEGYNIITNLISKKVDSIFKHYLTHHNHGVH